MLGCSLTRGSHTESKLRDNKLNVLWANSALRRLLASSLLLLRS
jgi:hypothetical protein